MILLLVLMLPGVAWAQLTNIQYTTASDGHGGLVITGFSASGSGALAIPSTITVGSVSSPVTGIGARAFYDQETLTSVTIPNGVTSIGDSAFTYCVGMTSVTIPGSVTSIGQSTFVGCSSLTTLTIPNSVTRIGQQAFGSCNSLTSVVLGNGVTGIPTYAFFSCPVLANITIGSGVTNIGDYAFQYCSGLTSVAIPANVTRIGGAAFYACTSLASVSIANGVTIVGGASFQGCSSLTSVTIPASVTNIGESAFAECASLVSITVSAQNPAYTSVGGVLFNLNQTILLQYPGGKAGSYTIPNGVINVANYAFYKCTGLTGVTIPNGVAGLGSQAFLGCTSLTSVTIPTSIIAIGGLAFGNCSSLTNVVFLGNAPLMGSYVFGWYYTAPSGFAISYYNDATGFTSPTWKPDSTNPYPTVNVGNSPTSIPATTSDAGPFTVFPDFYGGLVITKYTGSGGAIVLPGTITINSVTYPVTGIGQSAFAGRSSLTGVTIPDSVTYIATGAFQGCHNLTTVTIGNGVTSIGDDAFDSCTHLSSLTIGNGVTSIQNQVFQDCTSLSSVIIPGNVTSFGWDVFWGCTSLTSMVFQGNAPTLGSNAFYGIANGFTVYYYNSAIGFTSPTWAGFPAVNMGTAGDGISVSGNLTFGLVTVNTTVSGTMTIINSGSAPITVSSISYPGGFSGNWASGTIQPYGVQNVTVTFAPTAETPYGGNITVNSNAGVSAKSTPASGRGVNPAPFTIVSDGSGGLIITGYNGPGGAVIIPGMISDLPVTAIGDDAFYNNHNIASVTIPYGVTSIGEDAFIYCALSSVTIPNTVTYIGGFAFFDCSNLSSLTIGTGVTAIGPAAFEGCISLSAVVFLGNAPVLQGNVFYTTASGFKVYYYNDATGFTSPNWPLDPGDSYPAVNLGIPSPAKFTTVSDGNGGLIITGYTGSGGVVPIPGAINGLTVTGIGAGAFANKVSLTSITIPGSVISIGSQAFQNCTGLTSVTIPTGVTNIGSSAFENCSNLTSAFFKGNAPTLGGHVFDSAAPGFTVSYYTGTTGFTSPVWTPDPNDSYPAVALSPFTTAPDGNGGLIITAYAGPGGALVIPGTMNGLTVTGIGAIAFAHAPLTSVAIPSSITDIGAYAFALTGLTSVTIPKTVTSLEEGAFYECANLTSVVFRGNAPAMGGYVFFGAAGGFTVSYYTGATGFSSPTWTPGPEDSYPAIALPTLTFAQWAASQGIPNSPAATPEKDGVPNLLKYLYDINPTVPMTAADRAALATVNITTTDGMLYLTLTYRQSASTTGITVNVQTSSDLQNWTTVANPMMIQTGTDSDTNDPIMQVQVPVAESKKFIRLNVTQP